MNKKILGLIVLGIILFMPIRFLPHVPLISTSVSLNMASACTDDSDCGVDEVCNGSDVCVGSSSSSSGSVTITNPLSSTSFSDLLTQIAGQVGLLITYLGVIMIIVAGILYLTSAGSPERVGVAKKALIYAIAGIAIGLAATVIVTIIKNMIGVTS